MSPRLLCPALAAALGCATLPSTGAPPTGEPLGYRGETHSYTYATRTKVAEVQYRDSAGRRAGSATLYQSGVGHVSYTEWRPLEGGRVIDDEDFFRIAGDVEAARAIRDYREGGVLVNRLGWAVAALGAVGLAATRTADLDDGRQRRLELTSGLVMFGGALWAYYGYLRMSPDDHRFDLDRARAAAERYNIAVPRP